MRWKWASLIIRPLTASNHNAKKWHQQAETVARHRPRAWLRQDSGLYLLSIKRHGIYETSCLRRRDAVRPNITSNVDNNGSFVAVMIAVIIDLKLRSAAVSPHLPAFAVFPHLSKSSNQYCHYCALASCGIVSNSWHCHQASGNHNLLCSKCTTNRNRPVDFQQKWDN